MLPLVALVGRPNVGKSTLFNALTRTRDALVHDEPGVTHDRNYGSAACCRNARSCLVDTGGIAGEDEGLAGATARQSRAAAEEADLVLFVVDGREGASALDDEILAWLRRLSKPTLLIVSTSPMASTSARGARRVRALRLRGCAGGVVRAPDRIDAVLARAMALLPEEARRKPRTRTRVAFASPSSAARTWASRRW